MKKTDCTLYGYKSKAVISNCDKYRYELHREWDKDKEKVLFIMLNPSTADAHRNDLTTRRCINYAKKWGFGGLMIGNIYPFRAKRPKDLRKWLKGYGDLYDASECNYNISHLHEMILKADLVVCAWGGNHPGVPEMLEYTSDLHYLELCDDGITPKHPLGNLSKDLVPKQYNLNTIIDG